MNIMHHYTPQTRIQRFGKRAARILRSRDPLTDEQIRQTAPSIFASEQHSSRSSRYSYIPTSDVLASLRKEGFQPFMVQQGGSRDEEKAGFTKHLIRFRHESQTQVAVDESIREIVLVNSHDGTSTYQLMAGMFLLVCSNGMIVGNGLIDEIKVRHSGDVVPAVIDGMIDILDRLPEVNDSVRAMQALRLEVGEQTAFAKAALELRYDTEDKAAPIEAAQLLTLRRREDEAPNLWNTLNTVQENAILGGNRYIVRDENGFQKQRRKTGEVRDIGKNVSLNRALWTLAEEMKKLKA